LSMSRTPLSLLRAGRAAAGLTRGCGWSRSACRCVGLRLHSIRRLIRWLRTRFRPRIRTV